MVQRTIQVDITGEDKVASMTSKVRELANSVKQMNSELAGLKKKNPAITFKVKLKTEEFYTEYNKLKNLLSKAQTIEIGTGSKRSGSSTKNSIAKEIKESAKELSNVNIGKPIKMMDDYKDKIKEVQHQMSDAIRTADRFAEVMSRDLATAFKNIDHNSTRSIKGFKSFSNLGNVSPEQVRNLLGLASNVRKKAFREGHLLNKDVEGHALGVAINPSGTISSSKQATLNNLLAIRNSVEASQELIETIDHIIAKWGKLEGEMESPIKSNGLTDFLNGLEQIQNALNNISGLLQRVTTSSYNLGVKTPFRTLVSGYRQVAQEVIRLNTSMATSVANQLQNAFRTGFNYVQMYARQAFSVIARETQELGDAMTTYRNNMLAFGLDQNEVNANMLEIGDYGKRTVYNAGDLLDMVSTYASYGMSSRDSIDLAKAMAGLVSNQSNSTEAITRASAQLNDMLVRGYASLVDLRIMRSWMNPLASARLAEGLDAIAKDKGFDNYQQATKEKAITAQELQQLILRIGLRDGGENNDFQALVNSIKTPRQALANLQETVANLFAYDKITQNPDGTYTSGPGIFGRLYQSTASLIKGFTDNVIGSDTFQKGAEQVGNDMSSLIDSTIAFSRNWNANFTRPFIDSLGRMYNSVKRYMSLGNTKDPLYDISQGIIQLNNSVAYNGGGIARIVENFLGLGSNATWISSQAVDAGIFDMWAEIVGFFKNLSEVAFRSDAVGTFVHVVRTFWETVNSIITDEENMQSVVNISHHLRGWFSNIATFIRELVNEGNVIQHAEAVIYHLGTFLTNVIELFRQNTSYANIDKALGNFTNTFKWLLDSLAPIYAEIGSGLVNFSASNEGRLLMISIADFIRASTQALRDAIASFGGGSFALGLRNISQYLRRFINFMRDVVSTIGSHAHTFAWAFVGIKLLGGLVGFFQGVAGLLSTVKALGSIPAIGGILNKTGIASLLGLGGGLGASSVAGIAGGGFSWGGLLKGLAKGGLGILGSVAVGGVNNAIQNSNASDGVKKTSSFLGNIASGALTGAGFGGLKGAIIGGVLGLAKSVWDSLQPKMEDKFKSDAEREADKMIGQNNDYFVESVKEMAKQSRELRDKFVTSVLGTQGGDGLAQAIRHIEGLSYQSNISFTDALNKLGVNIQNIPLDIKDRFVKLGDEMVKFSDLMQQTGLSEVDLVGALKLLYSTHGEATLKLYDETNQMVQEMSALTGRETERQRSSVGEFSAILNANNILTEGLHNMAYNEIVAMSERLNEVMSGNTFASNEEHKEALINAIAGSREDIRAQLVNQSYEEIKALSETLTNASETSTATTEERHATLLGEYKEILKNSKDYTNKQIEKELTKHATSTLEELQKAVADEGAVQAIQARGREQFLGGSHSILTTAVQGFFNEVAELRSKGTISLNEAKNLLAFVDFKGIDTDALSKAGKDLYKETKGSIDKNTGKLKEGSFKVREAFLPLSTSELASVARSLGGNLRELVNSSRDKLSQANQAIGNTLNEIGQIAFGGVASAIASPASRNNIASTVLGAVPNITIPRFRANGGPIDWSSRGTDTVPAMLTPGEFVVRRRAVESVGMGFMKAINQHGVKALTGLGNSTIINNIYNTNNASVNQNIDNKSSYLNGMLGLDRLMRYV